MYAINVSRILPQYVRLQVLYLNTSAYSHNDACIPVSWIVSSHRASEAMKNIVSILVYVVFFEDNFTYLRCRGYSFCNPQRSTTPADEWHRSTRTELRIDLLCPLTSDIRVQGPRDLSETSVKGVRRWPGRRTVARLTFSSKSASFDWRRGTRQVVSRMVTAAAGRSLRVGLSSTFLPQDTVRTAQLSAKFVAIASRTSVVERPEHGRIPESAPEQQTHPLTPFVVSSDCMWETSSVCCVSVTVEPSPITLSAEFNSRLINIYSSSELVISVWLAFQIKVSTLGPWPVI